MKIEVFRQSAICFRGEKTIYFDPYQIKESWHDADYIFITHDHYDHYDWESIRNVCKENTKIIIPKSCVRKEQINEGNFFTVEENQDYQLEHLTFHTVPAYNIQKSFHPREKGYVGYVIELEGITYYIMGDTDRTKEAEQVRCDVCFVPIGGTYTMDVVEAAEYINDIKPKKAIPIHYGSIVGDVSLKDTFRDRVNKEIEVEIYI